MWHEKNPTNVISMSMLFAVQTSKRCLLLFLYSSRTARVHEHNVSFFDHIIGQQFREYVIPHETAFLRMRRIGVRDFQRMWEGLSLPRAVRTWVGIS